MQTDASSGGSDASSGSDAGDASLAEKPTGPARSALFDLVGYSARPFPASVTAHEVVNLLFELSGFPAHLFDEDELDPVREPSDVLELAEFAPSRARERLGQEPPAVSPLMAAYARACGERRGARVDALFKKHQELNAWGLCGAVASAKEFADRFERPVAPELQAPGRRAARAAPQLPRLAAFAAHWLHPADALRLAVLWLPVLADSPCRPLRLSAVLALGALAGALAASEREARETLDRSQTQLGAANEKRAVQQAVARSMETAAQQWLLASEALPEVLRKLAGRLADVSDLVVLAAVQGAARAATARPATLALSAEVQAAFRAACLDHPQAEVRSAATRAVARCLAALVEVVSVPAPVDWTAALPWAGKWLKQAVQASEERNNELEKTRERTNPVAEGFLGVLTQGATDPSASVGASVADALAAMARLEGQPPPVGPVAEGTLNEICSLLFSVENPVVRRALAGFVDGVVFGSSIQDAEATKALGLLRFGKPAEGYERLSNELSTLCEFFVHFADDPQWKVNHANAVKAFWPQTPVLHHWDVLCDFLCVACGALPLEACQKLDAAQLDNLRETLAVGDRIGLWDAAAPVRDTVSEALLTIVLQVLELTRAASNGAVPYERLADFDAMEGDLAKPLSPLNSSGGFDLASCAAHSLWRADSPRLDPAGLFRGCAGLLALAGDLVRSMKTNVSACRKVLAIIFEALDALVCLRETEASGREALLMRDVEELVESLFELTISSRDDLVLQGCFSLFRKVETGFPTESGCRLTAKIETFLDRTRLATLKTCSNDARAFLETGGDTAQTAGSLRATLLLLRALAVNEKSNTFRNGLEALDDLITLVEFHVEQAETTLDEEPRDVALIARILEISWIGLARWMFQIDGKYGALRPALSALKPPSSEQSVMSDTLSADHLNTSVETLSARVQSFKEDLDIFRELLNQFLSYSARFCGVMRGRLRQEASQAKCLSENNRAARKLWLVSTVRCVKLMLTTGLFHLAPTIWFTIQKDVKTLLDKARGLPQGLPELLREVDALSQSCRDPKVSESVNEVAFFIDFLKSLANVNRSLNCKRSLVKEARKEWFSHGLFSSYFAPRPLSGGTVFGVDVWEALTNCLSTTEENEFCNTLPLVSEMAYCYQIQLVAGVCQLPNVKLWRDALVGPVILANLRGRCVALRELAATFISRVRLYEKLRAQERQPGENEDPSLLCVLLLNTIVPLLDRALAAGDEAKKEEVGGLADELSAIVYPTYFLELDDVSFVNFIWSVVKAGWDERPEESSGKSEGVVVNMVAQRVLRGTRLRRKWTNQNQVEALAELVRQNFPKDTVGEYFLPRLKELMMISFGRVAGNIELGGRVE